VAQCRTVLALAREARQQRRMPMAESAAESPARQPRIEAIDLARGLALIAMAVYHFSWDLELFGYLDPGTTAHGWLRLLARCTASSFLVLVGVSLYLAHGRGIRWRSFLLRLAMVAGAALAITIATWFAMPESFIFFGILHEIALASVLGLAFLRLPALLTLAAAALVIVAPWYARSAFFDHPWLSWAGLSSVDPRSNDYVPIFPWFGAVLVGIGLAQLAAWSGLTASLAEMRLPRMSLLRFAGRHSLIVYLIHQPILIGIVWLATQVVPPSRETPAVEFRNACEGECTTIRDEGFCARYCVCMLEELERRNVTDKVFADQSEAFRAELQGLASQCTAGTDAEMGGQP
jgi:uncharacterized membrane protein